MPGTEERRSNKQQAQLKTPDDAGHVLSLFALHPAEMLTAFEQSAQEQSDGREESHGVRATYVQALRPGSSEEQLGAATA